MGSSPGKIFREIAKDVIEEEKGEVDLKPLPMKEREALDVGIMLKGGDIPSSILYAYLKEKTSQY